MSKPKSLTDRTATKYSDETVELGLHCLARTNGNTRQAAKMCGVSSRTLDRWRDRFADRYQEISDEVIPAIRQRVAERTLQIAEQAADAEEEAIALVRGSLAAMEPRDRSNAMRNLSTTKGIALTHANNFQSPPAQPDTGITADDVATIIDRLTRQGVLEGAAEEIPEADVINP